jgi:hypothetical protein
MNYSQDDHVANFLDFFDLGVPAAVLISLNAMAPTQLGIDYVNEAWEGICNSYGLDVNAEYEDADSLVEQGNKNLLILDSLEFENEEQY